jgi:hypothetical protein
VHLAWVAAASLIVSACASAPRMPDLVDRDESRSLFVIRRPLHTGIALESSELADTRLARLARGSSAQYLEFGWGDAVYYQAERTSPFAPSLPQGERDALFLSHRGVGAGRRE